MHPTLSSLDGNPNLTRFVSSYFNKGHGLKFLWRLRHITL